MPPPFAISQLKHHSHDQHHQSVRGEFIIILVNAWGVTIALILLLQTSLKCHNTIGKRQWKDANYVKSVKNYTHQRPYKVWNCDRESRKSVVAASLIELKLKAAEKFGYDAISDLKLVIEADGTEVEDDTYFQTAEKDTVFLLLRTGERWLPPGVEALKAAIKAIPKIVCDALNTLEIVDKAPSWKISDDRGNITVVLNWDQRDKSRKDFSEPSSWRVEVVASPPSEPYAQFSSSAKSNAQTASTTRANLSLHGLGQRPLTRTLPIRTLSTDEDDEYDYEKTERAFSPNHDHDHDHSLCDFHCAALHRGQIHINRSVATSPIQDSVSAIPLYTGISASADNILSVAAAAAAAATGAIPKRPAPKGHVRFMDTEPTKIPASFAPTTSMPTTTASATITNGSDSETETTEEQLCERYLLLTDQLTVDRDRHLNIKDIGVILERLNSKIVDIDKLEREKESQDCYNWVIKATIRGEVLREIGVIYNGQYYGIMEHPGYF